MKTYTVHLTGILPKQVVRDITVALPEGLTDKEAWDVLKKMEGRLATRGEPEWEDSENGVALDDDEREYVCDIEVSDVSPLEHPTECSITKRDDGEYEVV